MLQDQYYLTLKVSDPDFALTFKCKVFALLILALVLTPAHHRSQ